MITSTANQKIKFYKKLRNKKFRRETNLFVIEGPKLVADALASDWEIIQIFWCPELSKNSHSQFLVQSCIKKNIEIIEVRKEVFEFISVKEGPKGLSAIIKQKTYLTDEFEKDKGLWVSIDRIQDPGNLGSILRTLDAVGGKGIILIGDSTDPFEISSIRGSMGAIFNLKVIIVSEDEFIDLISKNDFFLVGTSDKAKLDYQAITYPINTLLLMGSEREGLSPKLIQICDKLVKIPMAGKSDSLNLAVATSVCLYEIYNQNRKLKSEK